MSAAKIPLLRVEHLTMRFGGLVAVNDVSFDAWPGEITAIIGPTAPARRRFSTALPASTARASGV
jgi:amino acid/amide ABC transporter ATP-binding protein 1, HAAT family (TC 3.A.1.4.-)